MRLSTVRSYTVVHPLTRISQDLDLEDEVPQQEVNYASLEPICQEDAAKKRLKDNVKARILYERQGFCREGGEGDGY